MAADKVFDKLEALSFSNYRTEPLKEGAKEQIRFVFHVTAGNVDTVEVVIYDYNSTECQVTLNGEPTITVVRTDVDKLITAVKELFAA